jgi:hypothetical protein
MVMGRRVTAVHVGHGCQPRGQSRQPPQRPCNHFATPRGATPHHEVAGDDNVMSWTTSPASWCGTRPHSLCTARRDSGSCACCRTAHARCRYSRGNFRAARTELRYQSFRCQGDPPAESLPFRRAATWRPPDTRGERRTTADIESTDSRRRPLSSAGRSLPIRSAD